MAPSDQSPSEVRRIILAEHDDIRIQMKMLEKHANSQDLTALTHAVSLFQKTFRDHLQHEEAILWPILKTIDSWGPVRLENKSKEHQEQRRMIENLSHLKKDELILSIQNFLVALAVDMADEESEFLNPEFMRDDVISSGFGG